MATIGAVPSDWHERIAALGARADRRWFGGLEAALDAIGPHAKTLDVAAIDRLFSPRAGMRFEPQTRPRKRGAPFSREASYDGSIIRRGLVPTREGSMHDLFNAMIWSVYPLAKRALHARQDAAVAREIAEGQTTLPGRRSRMRDRLSMLDEGGVLVWTHALDADLDHAIEVADLDAIRALARSGTLRARVFGHAILEHAEARDPSNVRGCVVRITPTDDTTPSIDLALAQALELDDESIERWIAAFPSIEVGALFA